MFEPINMDCIASDPEKLNRLADVLAYLSAYARIKSKAMYARRHGYLKTAMAAEQRADAIYVLLPDWARW